MDIAQVEAIVTKIANGIEESTAKCMAENAGLIADLVREQIYAGKDGKGEFLSPTYDSDPYFDQPGPWYHRAAAYKAWKAEITPPMPGITMGLAPRPLEVPNLFITGVFHDSIKTTAKGDGVEVTTSGFRDGPIIESKYGSEIFMLGDEAREYFVIFKLKDWLKNFYRDCGYEL